ncbi:trypsin-like serine protease [Streptomyces sp. NPDC006477]|uniref:trypsin-like serine protease n=1 Tax=Streptomyces sp. NPDC006477 TaxID=3364747 RepID=UPI0036979A57
MLYAVEDHSYPEAAKIKAEKDITLKRGDGQLLLAACDGTQDIMVNSRSGLKDYCFDVKSKPAMLSLELPDAYGIWTEAYPVKTTIEANGAKTVVDAPANDFTGYGEATQGGLRSTLIELRVTGENTNPPAPSGETTLAFTGKVTIGDSMRSCTATLVDPSWVVTAKHCFADNPADTTTVTAGAPKDKTTVTVGRTDLTTSGGHTTDLVQLVPHADRDLVMARLDKPALNVTPVALSTTEPAAGQDITVVGFGRTKTDWVPSKLHSATFTTGASDTSGFLISPKAPADATICQGDAGAPAIRTENGKPALVGITTRSGLNGCLDAANTTAGAYETRTDNLREWIQQTRALAPGWKAETLVQAGTSLYQGIRLADGTWTGFTDVQTKATNIGGVRTATAAGINADTHIVALGSDGKIYHTIRKADGTWTNFGHVGDVAGTLSNVTQLSAVSIGSNLHVVAIAGGKVFHTLRNATGHWNSFSDVASVVGPIGTVTTAATASVGGELQLIAVSGGKAFHTIRNTAGQWSTWGNVASAAGTTGPITSVSMAGTGGDAQIVIATDNGTRQYHAIRKADRTWAAFGDLKDYLGTVTVKSLGAAHVDGELQLTATTSDNKLIHLIRHADRTWTPTTTVALQGVTGTLGTTAITGTL